MNYIISEEKLIDYLYGEMDIDEKILFENALKDSPKWKQELAELKELHQKMSFIRDERSPQQIIIKEHIQKRPAMIRWLKPIAAVAAGIALFMLLGGLTGMQIEKYEGGLSLTFGKDHTTDIPHDFNDEEIQSIVNQIIEQRDQQWTQQLVDWRQDLKNDVKIQEESLEAVASEVKNINKRPNTSFVTVNEVNQILQKQRQEDQKSYETMVANLFEYLSFSREKDLQMIQQGFEDIKQYINISELEKNQILASYQENSYLNQ